MNDKPKTTAQLIAEVAHLRDRVAELETAQAELRESELK